jgi:hypothetical protein
MAITDKAETHDSKGKGGSENYSKNAKSTQEFEKKMSKSARRVSEAVKHGIDVYLEKRDKSVENLKDGAILESYVNVAHGLSEGVAKASPALADVADAINVKGTRKLLRGIVRSLPLPMR